MDSNLSIRLIQAVSNICVGLVIFDFMDIVYQKKYQSKCLYLSSYFVFVTGYYFVNLVENLTIDFLYGYLMFLWMSYLLFHSFRKKMLYNTIFVFYLITVEILSHVIVSNILLCCVPYCLDNIQNRLITIFLKQVVILMTYQFVTHLCSKNVLTSFYIKYNLFFIPIVLFQLLLIVLSSYYIRNEFLYLYTLMMVVIFLGMDIYIFYLLCYISKQYKIAQIHRLEEQQRDTLQHYYLDIEQKYEQSRKLIHDIKNHFQVIEHLYRSADNVAAQTYVTEIYQQMDKMGYSFKSKHQVLTILISDLIQQSENQKIQLSLDIQEIPLDFIENIDVTIILSNLFRNAQQACEPIDEEKRWIKVKMKEIHDHIIIEVSNSYLEYAKSSDELKLFQKTHSGIGLINIQNAINKYDGMMEQEKDGETYQTIIVIPIPEK